MKFKVGDWVVRRETRVNYKILEVLDCGEYVIQLPDGSHHYIESKHVDKDCRKLTKLELALL